MKKSNRQDSGEEEDDRPKKKPRRRDDDDDDEDDGPSGWERYQRSAVRYVVLGVLLVVMLVLGFFLWQKYQRDKEATGPLAASRTA